MLTAPILPIHSFTIRMEICISTVCTDSDSQALQRTPATQVKGCQSPTADAARKMAKKIICTLFLFSSDYNTVTFAIN